MEILKIVEELRKLKVPEYILEPIIKYHKESTCAYKNISPPTYDGPNKISTTVISVGTQVGIVRYPKCLDCGKTFNEDKVRVTVKLIEKEYIHIKSI